MDRLLGHWIDNPSRGYQCSVCGEWFTDEEEECPKCHALMLDFKYLKPEKPPMGIAPQEIWEQQMKEQRITDLFEAMFRYSEAGKPIPVEWLKELRDRTAEGMG